MSAELAYKMCLGMFKQDSSGTVYGKLPDEYAALKWNLTSIIPVGYDFTNYQVGDTTVETTEKNTITQLTKSKKYDSGAVTPPTFTLATLLPVDEATIISTLDALDVPDPFKVLMCAGVYKSVSNGVRIYDVINACCGVLITDGGRSAEAKNKFAGSLAVQACHLPIIGATDCGATMTWNESTGAIALVPAVSGGNG